MLVTILRGCPGSGKTTFIKNNFSKIGDVFSADHYFMKDGVYQFDHKKLGEAHGECLSDFTWWLTYSWTKLGAVIDNTNISCIEIAPYYQLALAFGQDVKIITINIDPEAAFKRNQHGVPLKTIQSMHDRLEQQTKQFPKHWNHTQINAEGL